MSLSLAAKKDNLALLLLYVQVWFCSEIDICVWSGRPGDWNSKHSRKKIPTQ